jgi:mannosyltransferase OCH1-like enzyme
MIIKNSSNNIFDFNIKYIDDYHFEIEIVFFEENDCCLTFINKYFEDEQFTIYVSSCNTYKDIIESSFQLLTINNKYVHNSKIPKIIHQSYKARVKKNMYIATSSWKLMNVNYEYKYWNDDECIELIKSFGSYVQDAYNMLCAGAYKSDIFRLCVLYKYGGIWTDISSECKVCLDKVIADTDLIIVKDTPVQINNGNIYQGFVVCSPENNIIKEILHFTVNRVLNYDAFNRIYPFLENDALAVTGPTIFAMGFNKTIGRKPYNSLINDNYIQLKTQNLETNVLLLNHMPGSILMNDEIIIKTKYDNWREERTNTHYDTLFKKNIHIKKNR